MKTPKEQVAVGKRNYPANSATAKRHQSKKRERVVWTGDMGPRIGSFKKQ